MVSKHTPTPWAWEAADDSMLMLGRSGMVDTHMVLAATRCKSCQEEPEKLRCFWPTPEDGDFILRAVNSHDDLLAACKALLQGVDEVWEQGAGARIVFNAKALVERLEAANA